MVYKILRFAVIPFVLFSSTSFSYFSVSSRYVIMPFDDHSLLFSVSNENIFLLFDFRSVYNFEIISESKEFVGNVDLYSIGLDLCYRNRVGFDRFIYIAGVKVDYGFYYYFSNVKFGGIIGGGYRLPNDDMVSVIAYLLPYGNSILIDFSLTLFKDYVYLLGNAKLDEVSKEVFSTLETKVFSFGSATKRFELLFLFGVGFSTTKGVLTSVGTVLNYDWVSISYVGKFQDIVGIFHEFGVELKRW